jgi:galactose oxidase-like protein
MKTRAYGCAIGLAFAVTLAGDRGRDATWAQAGVAEAKSGFELRDGSVHGVLPPEARQGASRTARVALPVRADEPVRIQDDTSRSAVTFALRGASAVPASAAGGIALYRGALGGADVVHRVHAEGTEDYVLLQERPSSEVLAYDVDVTRIAGLRLVNNTLEFLDEGGAPRLRVAPPYVVDATSHRTEATLAVEGCAVDVSPRAPWGRAVTPPGASRCGVRMRWKIAAYPAMVDPSWTATGSMATARIDFTATLLGSGEVLVAGGLCCAGGEGSEAVARSAELYDPATGTFAATGPMMKPGRSGHTATLLSSGRVLVAGGSIDATAELYDPAAGTFTATGSMTTPTPGGDTATLLGSGKVLIAGMTGANGDIAELYDPIAGTFAATGSLTTARAYHTATLLGSGDVLVAGGGGGMGGTVTALSTAELYDPTTGSFEPTGAMTAAREFQTATLLGSGEVLIAGGSPDQTTSLSTAELYDPTARTFSGVGSMAAARDYHTATLLRSGEVLIAGGLVNPSTSLSSAELYDWTSGTFLPTAAMATARCFQTATLLDSGEVLVAGGAGNTRENGVTVDLSSAELYCAPTTTCPDGDDCGTISDGCGGTVTCGACGSGEICVDDKCGGGHGDASADTGAGGRDSGPGGRSGNASDGGANGGSSTILEGCGCHAAPRQDVPPYAFGLGFTGAVGMRLRRRARFRCCRHRLAVGSA